MFSPMAEVGPYLGFFGGPGFFFPPGLFSKNFLGEW